MDDSQIDSVRKIGSYLFGGRSGGLAPLTVSPSAMQMRRGSAGRYLEQVADWDRSRELDVA